MRLVIHDAVHSVVGDVGMFGRIVVSMLLLSFFIGSPDMLYAIMSINIMAFIMIMIFLSKGALTYVMPVAPVVQRVQPNIHECR